MYLYRQLKRQSLIYCLKLSLPLIAFSAFGFALPNASRAFSAIDSAFFFLLFFVAPGLWGIGRLAYALLGRYQSRVRAYIQSAPDPELMLEQMEQAYSQADRSLNRLCIAGPWVLVQDGPATYLYETLDILWVYQYTETIRRGLSSSSTYHLTICDKDGDCLRFQMSKDDVQRSLQAFGAYAPFVVRGYSSQLSAFYQKSLPKFIEAVRQRQEQTISKQGGQDAYISTGN